MAETNQLEVPVAVPPDTVTETPQLATPPAKPAGMPPVTQPLFVKGPPQPGPRRNDGPRGPLPFKRSPQDPPLGDTPPQPQGNQQQQRPPRPDRGEPRGEQRGGPRNDQNRERPPQTMPKLSAPQEWGANKPNKRNLDASIEAEMAAAISDEGLIAALSETERPKQAPTMPGEKKRGKIIAIHGKDVFVEMTGGRGQGVLPIQQFTDRKPVIGEEVQFDIERVDGRNGVLVLTMEGASVVVTNWSAVQLGMIVEAKVTGVNKTKSGLLVEVNGIKGFMPMSQVDIGRSEQPEAYENQRLRCQVVELNPEERNLIVSRRVLLEKERAAKAEEFWAGLVEGQVRKGTVKSIKAFGAFVDLGGADGLIPISEFSWQRVENLEEIVKPGQEVEVLVNRLDFENRKIGLSLKALQGNPFQDFANSHRPGTRVTGKVTRIADFGAFVEVGPGIEGLIHVSEMSTQRIRRVRDVVAEGDEVTVQVVNVDVQARRVALTLKTIEAEAEAASSAAATAEAEADRKAAAERMANRTPGATNLRGGMGGGAIKFG